MMPATVVDVRKDGKVNLQIMNLSNKDIDIPRRRKIGECEQGKVLSSSGTSNQEDTHTLAVRPEFDMSNSELTVQQTASLWSFWTCQEVEALRKSY